MEVKTCHAILKNRKGGFKQHLETLPQHLHITLSDVTNKYNGKGYRVNFTNYHTRGKEYTVNGTIHLDVEVENCKQTDSDTTVIFYKHINTYHT